MFSKMKILWIIGTILLTCEVVAGRNKRLGALNNVKLPTTKSFTRIKSKNADLKNIHVQWKENQVIAKQQTNKELEIASNQPQPSMFAINLLNFLFYGTMGTVMPFLPTFYKHLGVSDVNIGVLGAISPAITFIVSPLWSAFADTSGKHRSIMLLTFIGSILSRCVLAAGRNDLFWLSAVVSISAILNAPVKPLLDTAIMSMLTDKSSYGRSRLYGQVGLGVGSFVVDRIIKGNIRAMFFVHLVLSIPTAFLMMIFEPHRATTPTPSLNPSTNTTSSKVPRFLAPLLNFKPRKLQEKENNSTINMKPEKVEIWKTLKPIVYNYKIAIFFTVVLIIGISSGIIENFAYVRLAEMTKGDRSSFGALRLASSLTGGPMFWLSGSLIHKLGVHGVMTLSLISYVLRFLIYGMATNVWFVLPAEMLRGFTFALFWAGATYYVYQISPKNLTATMLGILNGIYGGVGQSLGSLIGGELSRRFGIKTSFLYCAIVELIILVSFILYQALLHITDAINGNGSDLQAKYHLKL